jgi:putative polyketide hydroxylase
VDLSLADPISASPAAALPSEVPVLIVGGGPIGLTSALLLARQNVPTLLIERHPGTSIHPRARGINIRTMEIFRSLGLEAAIREAGAQPLHALGRDAGRA